MSTAIYIFIGYDEARRSTPKQDWKAHPASGFMGVIDECDRAAMLVDAYWDARVAADPEFMYPGVWDYEVSESMGHWLYFQDACWSEADFNAEMHRFVSAEIAKTP